MFQPRVKLEFVRRYCPPQSGWTVFVDIDPSEEGRTGGKRTSVAAMGRQVQMVEDATNVREEFNRLKVTVGGNRVEWFKSHRLPRIVGDRDIIAFHLPAKRCVIAEVEGASAGQPEQKLYKAIGQIVIAASSEVPDGWSRSLVLVVHGTEIAKHLDRANALKKLSIAALAIGTSECADRWLFGSPVWRKDLLQ